MILQTDLREALTPIFKKKKGRLSSRPRNVKLAA